MKSPFSLNQARFYYPGQEIEVKAPSYYNISKEEFKDLESGQRRLIWLVVSFVFAFLVISGTLFEYTVLNDKDRVKTAKNKAGTAGAYTERADIVDRNGLLLATDLPTVTLCSDNKKIVNREDAARKLVEALPSLKYKNVLKILNKNSRCAYLKRGLTPKEHYEVHRLGIPAFEFREENHRVYPQGNLFAHIVGAVDVDNVGISGIEKTFNEELSNSKEPLRLSVDVGVQDSVRTILNDAIKKYGAKAGTGIVMDVNTSEIIAMTSLPDFNPNNFSKVKQNALFNRATLGVYEMGSVFKIFNTALGLETKTIKVSDKIDSSPLILASYTIKDTHPTGHDLTPMEIMIHSSNTASARIAMKVGEKKQQEFLKKIGLFRPLSVEIPEKGKPILPKVWRGTTSATVAYGYGISVTPLHLVNAVGAIVNGGHYSPATLLSQRETATNERTRVMSEKTSKNMRKILRAVVTKGTGKNAEVAGYNVGGKTGSAEIIGESGKYEDEAIRTSFVSVFPSDNPRYVLFVMLDDPKKGKEGFNLAGWNVVPASKKIIETIAPQLNVLPNFDERI